MNLRVDKNINKVISDNYERVFCYLYSILRDKHAAEDVAQEVFLLLWKKKDINVDSDVHLWLLKSAKNIALNYIKKKKPISSMLFEMETGIDIWRNYQHEPENNKLEKSLKIQECRLKLPNTLSDVINLFYDKEYKGEKIAQFLNITVEAVHLRLSRARKKLRECLMKKGVIV